MKRTLVRVIVVLAVAFYGGLTLGTFLDDAGAGAASSQASGSPGMESEPAQSPAPMVPLPSRTACGEIAGTDYRSDDERDWYLANCVAAFAPAASQAAFAPALPAIPGAETKGERWILVDTEHERMTAMIGDQPLYTAFVTTGKEGWETPHGTFAIIYRVANETMTSASIGAEEDYVLKDVLYTQYFTTGGHAIHLNYWRPDDYFGRVASSHGCVGARLADAEFFWRFATYGTRVTVV